MSWRWWASNHSEPTTRKRYKQTSEIALLTDLLQIKDNWPISFIDLKIIKHRANLNIPVNINIPISYQYAYIFQQQHL